MDSLVQLRDAVKDYDQVLKLSLYVLLGSSSAFYTYIWRNPSKFQAFCGESRPTTTMSHFAHVLKFFQMLLIVALVDWKAASSASAGTIWASALLVLFGQHFNIAVYNTLGIDGIFYGSRFGMKLPWVTGYPYNVPYLRDPQYLGAMLSLLGGAFFMPLDICIFWGFNYFYLVWMESKVPSTV